MHFNLCEEAFRKRLIVEGRYSDQVVDKNTLKNLLISIGNDLKMNIEDPLVFPNITEKTLDNSFQGIMGLTQAGVTANFWNAYKFATIDIYSNKGFETDYILKLLQEKIKFTAFSYYEIPDPNVFQEDKRIELREVEGKGSAVFATSFIPINTILSYVDGQVFYAKKESGVPFFVRDHAVPFHSLLYRNAFNTKAVKFNHSCDPNTYFNNLFFVTTMRDIQPGEELTYSYSLICNSDWENPEGKCLCSSLNCLGKILPWRKLPKEQKIKYLPFTSEWILFEEMKKNNFLSTLKEIIYNE